MSTDDDNDVSSMDLWVYRSENGEVSVVHGFDRAEAAAALDEQISSSEEDLEPYEGGSFFVIYTPVRDKETGEAAWVATGSSDNILDALGNPEKALKRYEEAEGEVEEAILTSSGDLEILTEQAKRLASEFRKRRDSETDKDKARLWNDAFMAMEGVTEALDGLGGEPLQ